MIEPIQIVSDRHISQLMDLFATAWWTQGRSLEQVQTMLATLEAVVALRDSETDELIGFACAMTDGAFRAVIMDVIVRQDYQGNGVGQLLMRTLLEHPSLSELPRINLHCREELFPFYEKLGFTNLPHINVMKFSQ